MFRCSSCQRSINPQYCGDEGSVWFCSACMKLHREAIEQGDKDETSGKCSAVFYAHKHLVRCDTNPCPMVSPKDSNSVLALLGKTGGEK